jgi:predicted aconitase with swiveling domain
MAGFTLKGRTIVEGHCRGEALVSARPLSFLGGVDPADGRIIDRTHDLYDKCIKDRILCFPHGRGSTVGSYVLYSLARRKLAPKAIINHTADPVVAVGAIISDTPMVDQVDIKKIRTGDLLEVDAGKGGAKITKGRQG